MKIRVDFVTNSSSSSFVTYNLEDSEFCKYLTEQMEKNNFSYSEFSPLDDCSPRMAKDLTIDSDYLYADISCICDGLNCDLYAPEIYEGDDDDYDEDDYDGKQEDIEEMSEKFLDVIGEFVDLSKVDDPAKLFDAFLDDLKNDRFDCDVYMGSTD